MFEKKFRSIELRRIECQDEDHEHSYLAILVDRNTEGDVIPAGLTAPYYKTYAKFLIEDRHYLLMQDHQAQGHLESVAFGVLDETATGEQIDARLHRQVKLSAENLARVYLPTSLRDLTEFAEKDLPRGGK